MAELTYPGKPMTATIAPSDELRSMNEYMKGLDYTKSKEGWNPVLHDVEGIQHIGHGFNVEENKHVRDVLPPETLVEGGRPLTEEEGSKAFVFLYDTAADEVKGWLGDKHWDKLAPHQQQALTDMSFQMGLGQGRGLRKFKRLRQNIIDDQLGEAAEEILRGEDPGTKSKYYIDHEERALYNYQRFRGDKL